MKESTVNCSVTYLWSFTRAELGLPADATDAELKTAVEAKMEKITDYITHMINIYHSDLEISAV